MSIEVLWLRMAGQNGEFRGALRIRGSTEHVDLPIRFIAHVVSQSNAAQIHLTHNHPSGNCRPSAADIDATRRIWRMARSLGVLLQDHVITSDHGRFSFRAHGLL